MRKIVTNKIVLLAVSLVLIGAIGVIVWSQMNKNVTNTTTNNSTPTTTGTNITDTTKNAVVGTDIPFILQPGWKVVQDLNKTISIQIPSNWYSYSTLKNFNQTTLSNVPVSTGDMQTPVNATSDFSAIYLSIGGQTVPQGEDLYAWHKAFAPQAYTSSTGNLPVEYMNISNHKTVLDHSNSTDIYWMNKGSDIIGLTVSCPNPDLCAVSKQILGTVQFN